MTTQEAKNAGKTAVHSLAKAHWPNWVMLAIGTAIIALGWSSPEQSSQLINTMIGLLVSGMAGFNATRVGVTKKIEEQQQGVEQTVVRAMDKTYEQQMLSITSAIIEMGTATTGLRRDMLANHAANRQDHEKLLESLAVEKEANDRQHAEHRERIVRLETGQQQLAKEVGEVAGQVKLLVDRAPAEPSG